MADAIQSAAQIYADELVKLGHGTPLWRPSPLFNYTKVSIGDVGYVYNGRFNKLFNATNPPPSDFLHGMPSYRPGATHYDPPSSPGALYFGTIQRKGVRFGVESQLVCVDSGVDFTFDTMRARGAIAITKHKTFHEDVLNRSRSKRYMRDHYNKWLAFANSDDAPDGNAGIREQDLIFVDGFDVTSDWALMAFQDAQRDVEIGFSAGVPSVATAHAGVWGGWHTAASIHRNCGPEKAYTTTCIHSTPENHAEVSDGKAEADQCIFIRGWRVKKRPWWPTTLRAAGEVPPDEQHPPDRADDDDGVDGFHAEQMADSDDDLEYVGADRFIDPLKPLLTFIFDSCREAETAMVHDSDFNRLLQQSSSITSIPELLLAFPPQIEIDEHQVATLAFNHSSQSMSARATDGVPLDSIPETTSHDLSGISSRLTDHPLLSGSVVWHADSPSDANFAMMVQSVSERGLLDPSTPAWLENWSLLLEYPAIGAPEYQLSQQAVRDHFIDVYNTVREATDLSIQLAKVVIQSTGTMLTGNRGPFSQTVCGLLGEEIVRRSVEVNDHKQDYDDEGYPRLDTLEASVEAIVYLLETAATRTYRADSAPVSLTAQSDSDLPRLEEMSPPATKDSEAENALLAALTVLMTLPLSGAHIRNWVTVARIYQSMQKLTLVGSSQALQFLLSLRADQNRSLLFQPSPFKNSLDQTSASRALPSHTRSYAPERSRTTVALPLHHHLAMMSQILFDTRFYGSLAPILEQFLVQLSNKPLFDGTSCRNAMVRLMSTIIHLITRSDDAQELTTAYKSLSVLISYKDCFTLVEHEALVEALYTGLKSRYGADATCIQALSAAAFDLQPSLLSKLSDVLKAVNELPPSHPMDIHILNFVISVGSICSLHAHFTRDHFDKAFAIALKLLIQCNADNSTLTALTQHTQNLAFMAVYTWFLALPLSERRDHVTSITRSLLMANEGNDKLNEQTDVCFDWMARYTYANVEPHPTKSLLDKLSTQIQPGHAGSSGVKIEEKTWLLGSSAVITIRTLPKQGWTEVVARRPSGVTQFLNKLQNIPDAGPGEVEPDMLSLPGILMMERNGSEASLTHIEKYMEASYLDSPEVSTKPSLPDSLTGYVWSGTEPSQRRKNVSIDSAYMALQLSPYPHSHIIARGTLIKDQNALSRFIRVFDRLPVVATHEIGVIYLLRGQSKQEEILRNAYGSPLYTRFLEGLGRLIDLREQPDVYVGGLDADLDGSFAYAWWDELNQIIFHTATLMPTSGDSGARKMQHIGNILVCVVWNESDKPYQFDTLHTQFQMLNIVIEPTAVAGDGLVVPSQPGYDSEYLKVTVQRAPDVPDILPIGDFKIISAKQLPCFVRQISLLASQFLQTFIATSRDTAPVEVRSPWQERLRAIRKFARSVKQAEEAAGDGSREGVAMEGLSAQEALRDFSSSY